MNNHVDNTSVLFSAGEDIDVIVNKELEKI